MRALLRDPYIVAAGLLVVLVSVPLTTQPPKTEFWTKLYPFYFDAPLLAVTAFTVWIASRGSATTQADRFWTFMAAGFLFWLCVRLTGPLIIDGPPLTAFIRDLLYLAFYLCLILAFQLRPHLRRRDNTANLIRQLESSGATLFCFGVLIYLVVLPAAYNPSALLTNIPSTMLYVVLNFYLFMRAAALKNSCEQPLWREIYSCLVLATAAFVLLDGLDLAIRFNDTLDALMSGTLFEALWLLPLLGFVAASRLYKLNEGELSTEEEDTEALVWKWRGKLAYFALIPPLIHISMELAGWADEQTRTPREVLVVVWVFLAAGLSFIYDNRLISQQQKLEKRHREVNHQLEIAQRMDVVRRMAGGIAHDFNNLLMVIQGFADALAGRLKNEDDRRDAEQISMASQRAASLTQQLLAFGSREKIGVEPFLPTEILENMAPTLQQLTTYELEFDLQETGYVMGDPGAFSDSVLNLVLNARDASPEGSVISIRTGKLVIQGGELLADTLGPGNYGYVTVEDSGEGMDEETRNHIFEPFFSNREGGTGLGLSMVYSFAHEAGGMVHVESTPRKGSRFRIILPQGYSPRDEEHQEFLHATQPRSAKKVLLVEDEGPVRDVLKRSLENEGIEVFDAENGREALQLLKEAAGQIDLVITDVVMPEMDGRTLARHVKEIDRNLPIIFMTGHSAGQFEHPEDGLGPLKILRKPFSAHELLSEIEGTLNTH